MEPILEAEHVSVAFGPLFAVRDVSITLEPGSLVGLVGPNGSGKTTICRAIAGLQQVTTGRIRVSGVDVRDGRIDAMRQVGFAPDTPPIYDNVTVDEFLHFVGNAYDLGDRVTDEKIDFWLDQLWLTEKRKEKISALSRGMRQRLTIARTMLPDPRMILLDEPAAGLDPAGRVQFRELLTSIRDQGKVLIVSSHILADLDQYCTHIAIIERGVIKRFSTVREFVEGTRSEFCRYRITLSKPIAGIAEKLADIPELKFDRVDGRLVMITFHENDERAAELLRELMRRGIPISSFAPIQLNLEEAYLRTASRQVD